MDIDDHVGYVRERFAVSVAFKVGVTLSDSI